MNKKINTHTIEIVEPVYVLCRYKATVELTEEDYINLSNIEDSFDRDTYLNKIIENYEINYTGDSEMDYEDFLEDETLNEYEIFDMEVA